MMTDPIAIVRHVTRNHVTISAAPGFSVITFNIGDGPIEAIVSDGVDTVRLLIAQPAKGQTLSIKSELLAERELTHILYVEKKPNG